MTSLADNTSACDPPPVQTRLAADFASVCEPSPVQTRLAADFASVCHTPSNGCHPNTEQKNNIRNYVRPLTRPSSHSINTHQMMTSLNNHTTGAATCVLTNHGKKWTTSDDAHITGQPSLPDSHFTRILCLSEQAVQSRRAVLAAKLHKNSGTSIQECARELGADAMRVEDVVNNETKRTAAKASTKIHRTSSSPVARPPPTAVGAICNHIKRTKGDLDGLWAQDALVPTLILFHTGFQAYAAFISAEHRRASQR
jgi:hypothetical protein